MSGPVENGERLATIPRRDGDELRLSWAEYNGHNFLNVRVWHKDDNANRFPYRDKGLTVRLAELEEFVEGIQKAVKLARSAAQTPQGAPPTTRRKIGRAKQKPTPRRSKSAIQAYAAAMAPFDDNIDDVLPSS